MDIALPPDFKELLKLLKNKNIRYLLIGGLQSGVDFEECFQQRIIDEIDGIEVNIISLAQLKVNKKASGRHKDLDDIENLS
jgi:hypothetical protein